MKIALVSSEVEPFAKTGGLADVAGALPVELAKLGHELVVFQPAYRSIRDCDLPIRETDIQVPVELPGKPVLGRLLKGHLPGSDVPIYFVDQPAYFDRDGLYQNQGVDFEDNSERFTFFCRAVIEAIQQLKWSPDLIHCNDWQTGLIPAYLKTLYQERDGLRQCASLMSIHNLAYQGNFWHWDMLLTGLDWKYFNWSQMEFYGRLNLLKTGIVFADALSTVSPRYAEEIQTAEHGCGLQGVLSERRKRLTGILNGIDIERWNPAKDPFIVQNYSVDDWRLGKADCKAALQRELGLPPSTSPMVAMVGRLASQKGWSLVLPMLEFWLRIQDVQWVVLGTGESEFEQKLKQLAQLHPKRLAARIEFSDALAHRIESAADIFLMPSQYEPCGLNQQYSMRYGTVPVVHATGGLADTVVDASPENLADGTACGFSFEDFCVEELETALARAVDTYLNRPRVWSRLVETGMRHDWSWASSAKQYAQLYGEIIGNTVGSYQTVRT